MVEAHYRIESSPQGPVAVLEDQPLVWYSAVGQTKYREYLGYWLGLGAWDWPTPTTTFGEILEFEDQLAQREVFPKRIEGLIQLGGKWAGFGDLRPQSMEAQQGWLSIGWKQVPKPVAAEEIQPAP